MKYKKFVPVIATTLIFACGVSLAAQKDIVTEPTYQPVFAWPEDTAANKITIKGTAELTEEQMVAYIKNNTPTTKLNCSVEDIVHYYYQEGKIEGVRADIALCQAIKETGWFCYGGTVVPEQNNYCGLGTTSSTVKGHYFATPELGVRAHIHHLLVYAQKQAPVQELADPRYQLVVDRHPDYYGNMMYWTDLNGRWAVPGKHYGEEILLLWDAAKNGSHNTGLLDVVKANVDKNPDSYEAWYAYAKLAHNLGQYKDATKAYEKLISLNEKEPSPYLELASIYNDWGFDSKAVDVYNKLLKFDPYNKEAIRGKAYEMAFLGKKRAAVIFYSQVLRMDENDTLSLYNRGNLLKQLGKNSAGEEDLTKLKKLQEK
ncbi:MAG: glucosaminidase domain-containing protein [Phascolarctobacterium sp.]|nr:glucosaminidase domain-containing protein [Phascolarctobacterium sp.]